MRAMAASWLHLMLLAFPDSKLVQIGHLTVPFLMCYGPLPVCDSFNMTPFALLGLSNAGSVTRHMGTIRCG